MGNRPSDVLADGSSRFVLDAMGRAELFADVNRMCAGSKPPQNGLEERLDMIAAQLSVIAYELHVINERNDRHHDR